ncbi:MAG TPA: hypothetical protein VD862_02415 [Candidatus Paceibacterota bacterium]|nr:hypothetical protein [Candidatus Paceibacterota bacterium]
MTQTVTVARRVYAHVLFTYEAGLQNAIWRRVWLMSRIQQVVDGAMMSVIVSMVLTPFIAMVLGPDNGYTQVVIAAVLMTGFGRAMLLGVRFRRLRMLADARPGSLTGTWDDVDAGILRVQFLVEPGDPRIAVTVELQPGDLS